MQVKVVPLPARRVAAAARLLARAFAHDPLIGVLLGGRDPRSLRHRLAYPAFFRTALRDALATGRVDAAVLDGRLVGVAAWMDPTAPLPAATFARRVDLRLVRLLYPDGLAAIEVEFEALAELHPPGPHRYLAFVGVDPDVQAAGIGSALLGPALAAADAAGVDAYLETPFERTLPFYRRLGFEVERALPVTFGLGPLWTMRRPAGGGAGAGAARGSGAGTGAAPAGYHAPQ